MSVFTFDVGFAGALGFCVVVAGWGGVLYDAPCFGLQSVEVQRDRMNGFPRGSAGRLESLF